MNIAPNETDKTKTWAYGIIEPGWYCARGLWMEDYTAHLRSLGYRVERSEHKPDSVKDMR